MGSPPSPGRGSGFAASLPVACHGIPDGVFAFSAFPTSGPFIVCCKVAVQLVFRSFSEGIVPYVTADLVCPWEKVSLGFSYSAILDCPVIHFRDEETEEDSYWIICQCHTSRNWLKWDLSIGCMPLWLMSLTPVWYIATSYLISGCGVCGNKFFLCCYNFKFYKNFEWNNNKSLLPYFCPP